MNCRDFCAGMATLILAACTATVSPAPAPAPASDALAIQPAAPQDAAGEAGRTARAHDFSANAETIRADMAFLADDALEGREAGTPGHDKAAEYVASRFAGIGLEPAGTAGYFQPVPFRRAYRDPAGLGLTIAAPDGRVLDLERGVDYEQFAELSAERSTVSGELVFVGFGIVAPEIGRDDYADVDVNGKIVVALSGSPKGIQTEERAYYRSQRRKEASERGAVGFITVSHPERETVFPFERLIGLRYADQARLGWLRPDGSLFTRAPGLRGGAFLSMAGARKLFAAAGMDYDAIVEAAESVGGPTQSVAMGLTASITMASTHDTLVSPNVIGLIRGTDPELGDEYIVLTAHLDHIGISASFAGDRINNGALDNAGGVASLLEAARILAEGPAPRRSILFIALTAEEKGLLGAQYFTEYPTVPKDSLVGNVNLDMPILTHDFVDVVVYGGGRSTILAAIEAATSEMGITISEDREPEQGSFTRSDHFRFVEAGIPSVFLVTGYENGGVEAKAEHRAKTYHMPADEIDNPKLDFEAGARFAELNARVAVVMANADQRPLWQAGDFFARQFGGPTGAD